MANTIGIDFDDDLREINDDIGQAFTWPATNGSNYTAQIDAVTEAREFPDTGAGWLSDDALTIVVRTSLFTSGTPQKGDKILYRGGTYRIARKRDDAIAEAITLWCEEIT
jgi:hypothetical protein